MEQNATPETTTTSAEYHRMTNKFFYGSLVTIPVFAVPAFTALVLGRYADAHFGTGNVIMGVALGVAFVSSWYAVFRIHIKLRREYRALKEKMKHEAAIKEASETQV